MSEEFLPCCFCNRRFSTMPLLSFHLVESHKKEKVPILDKIKTFSVYRMHGLRIHCFCGKRFKIDSDLFAREIVPLFVVWVAANHLHLQELTRHLHRDGGIVPHLERVREEAMLDRIHNGPRGIPRGVLR